MKVLTGLAVCAALLLSAGAAAAQQPLEVYRAYLSERDHFNSYGERLRTVAGIIRQDRANFHRYGLRDPGDQYDRFFAVTENRARLEALLLHSRMGPLARDAIINGTPTITVYVYSDYVDVDVE